LQNVRATKRQNSNYPELLIYDKGAAQDQANMQRIQRSKKREEREEREREIGETERKKRRR